jgi:hypothetical protein
MTMLGQAKKKIKKENWYFKLEGRILLKPLQLSFRCGWSIAK